MEPDRGAALRASPCCRRPPGDDSDFTLTVTATATETGAAGSATIAVHALDVIASPPIRSTVRDAGGERQRDSSIALNITTIVADVITDTVAITITGRAGQRHLVRRHRPRRRGVGADAGGSCGLTVAPPTNGDADFTLSVTRDRERTRPASDGQSHDLAVTVAGVADAPSSAAPT